MAKKIKQIYYPKLLVFLVVWLCLGCSSVPSKKIRIATAANMQFAMEALVTSFTAETAIACELIIGSSGKLTAQIIAGAPYDIFVAADMKYPNELFNRGYAVKPSKVYAHGTLVLWTLDHRIVPSLSVLKSDVVPYIAIANPSIAPYGKAAIEVLKANGLYAEVKQKLVYGESIAQTNQFINSGAARIGFTAKSVVLAPRLRKKGNWISIPDSLHTKIDQGMVQIKRDTSADEAAAFYNFLTSEKAKVILRNFGYIVTER